MMFCLDFGRLEAVWADYWCFRGAGDFVHFLLHRFLAFWFGHTFLVFRWSLRLTVKCRNGTCVRQRIWLSKMREDRLSVYFGYFLLLP